MEVVKLGRNNYISVLFLNSVHKSNFLLIYVSLNLTVPLKIKHILTEEKTSKTGKQSC